MEQRVFPMSGVHPDTLRQILDFVYTGSMSITEDNVQEILIAADQFNMIGLLVACFSFLAGMLHPNNCIGIWRLTDVYVHAELHSKAFSYILDHFEEVVYCDEFLLLSGDELSDFIDRDDLIVRTESAVFEAVLRWIGHDPEQREQLFPALLHKVRLALLDLEYISTTVLTHDLVQGSTKCTSIISTSVTIIQQIRVGGRAIRTSNPQGRPRMPSAILLAIGGWSGGDPTNGIEAYDIRADSWINMTNPLERPRAYHGAAFLDGYVYCIGGFDRVEHFSSVRRFDLATRTWQDAGHMSQQRCYVSVAVLDGRIYAMGGFDGHLRHNTAECYRPEDNQWTAIAPMHEQRSDASCTTFQNNIYICGGFNGQDCLQTAEYYTPETGQWTQIAPMNCRRSGVGVVAYEGRIYAVGGFDGSVRQRTVEAYNPRTNTWEDVAPMITPRSNFGIEVLEGRLFVAGGFNGLTTIYNVECYSAATNEWQEACDMDIFRSALSCCVVFGLPNMSDFTLAQNRQVELEEEAAGSSSSS